MHRLRTPHGHVTLRLPDEPGLAAQVIAAAQDCLRGARAVIRLPLPPGTPFQQACWRAARRIPRGQTRTYGWLAAQAGSPGAVRAAAQAMRRNPWPLAIPCHRVVGVRDLGGYAGSRDPRSPRMALKKWLLAREADGGSDR
jgi:methylated-DNA-[protein]-cysteine S-methyltransferase